MRSRFRLKLQFRWTFNEYLKKLQKNWFLNEITVQVKFPIQMDFKIPIQMDLFEYLKESLKIGSVMRSRFRLKFHFKWTFMNT